MYNYINSVLTNRSFECRVGCSYSTPRSVDMGIPQGSVIAPLLFNILIFDLPKCLSKQVVLVQYADDICMWSKVTMRKNTPKRTLKYIQRYYQLDLNKIGSQNGLSLSAEKTCMMLFNPGYDPKELPVFKIENEIINYKQTVTFLGVHLTSKLTWNSHI